ncbi:hypothetical protein [Mediterraneibacter gnavus]|jgi:hypothetical protein|uniref:hypothetical protein n=1 Tax=Mediterraneibacter gnavus TaxID=33038 RepID=UPI0015F3112C|nr:hypothetical protein [Mediterraneibacter gnavus]
MKLWKNKKMNKNVVQTSNCEELDENAMKRVFGSGNSQVRYISDEYIQAKILKMRIGV